MTEYIKKPSPQPAPKREANLDAAYYTKAVNPANYEPPQPYPVKPKGITPPPEPLSVHLNRLRFMTQGETQNTIAPSLANKLDDTPYVRTVAGQMGRAATANISMGTTRNLAKLPKGDRDRVSNYRMPVTSSFPANKIIDTLRQAKAEGQLAELLSAYQQATGKSLATVIGEQVRNPEKRAVLQSLLPEPISRQQAIHDSFLENLAVGMVYSNAPGQQLNTDKKPDPRRGGVSQEILDAFGYTAGDNQSGVWGLQMRVFTPDKVKGKNQPVIIAFRGTEGVSMNAKAPGEGALDTIIGDFSEAQPGVNQFEANRDWIALAVKAATAGGRKVTFVGHSLGGALAQEAAAAFPSVTKEVVTFQAANVPQEVADSVAEYNQTHQKAPIKSRHYRVDGDIVPTAGDAALPGDIYYFDRLSRKPKLDKPRGIAAMMNPYALDNTEPLGSAPADQQIGALFGQPKGFGGVALKQATVMVAKGVPFLPVDTLQKGHVIPSLSMYLRGSVDDDQKITDPKLAALMHGGIRDEQMLAHTEMQDGKPVNVPAQEDVTVSFGGHYTTQADPRIQGEQTRATASPMVLDITQAAAQVFQANIAYNTALRHILDLAKSAKDFETFQQEAQTLLGQPKLKMTDFDIQLAEQLHLDKSPRQNAEIALKQLADVDRQAAQRVDRLASTLATIAIGPNNLGLGGNRDYTGLAEKYDEYLDSLAEKPVLEQYREPKGFGFEVPLNEKITTQFGDITVLKRYWKLYHPDVKK